MTSIITHNLIWFVLFLSPLSCNEGKVDPPAAETPTVEARPLVAEKVAAGEGEKSELCAEHSYQYANDIKTLSTENCSCHEVNTKPDLTNFENWQIKIDSTIKSIQGITTRMPLGKAALSTDQINGIKNWKECDYPE